MKRLLFALLLTVVTPLTYISEVFATEIVLVATDGEIVTDYDIQQRVSFLSWIQNIQKDAIKTDESALYPTAIQQMIMELLQRSFILQRGIKISDAQIASDIKPFLQTYGLSIEEIQKQFTQLHISYETLKEFIRGQIIYTMILHNFIVPTIRITKQEVMKKAKASAELSPTEYNQVQQVIMQEKVQKEFRKFIVTIRQQFFVEQIR